MSQQEPGEDATAQQPAQQPAPQPAQQDLLPGLVRARVRRGAPRSPAPDLEVAADLPVAQVLVDAGLAHLDRNFDYVVPATMATDAQPGVRVKVRFAGKDVDGFVLARVEASDHPGRLTPIRRVVSAEQVLAPAIVGLAADLASRYAGTRWDVLRLAIPPRHATTEKQASVPEEELPTAPDPTPDSAPDPTPDPTPVPAGGGWSGYDAGPALVGHLREGGSPRAVWSAAPGEDWPARLAEAAAACRASGRGVVLCVPDGKDVARVDAALTALWGPGHHVALTADAGPTRRYRDFLSLSRGTRRVVVGTRSAAFAPVHDLGLVVVWDDGDDLHAEPRAPYPHTREVLLLRAEREGTAVLVGGFARSVEASHLVATGWAREVAAPRARLREQVSVAIAGASETALARDPHALTSRFPRDAHQLLRSALETGPVLVQTPRLGYATSLACDRCRTPARCATCTGPLALSGPTTPPACRWCGTVAPRWTCPECGGHGLRAPVLGDARTAEELGRAFPGARVRSSSGDAVLAVVEAEPALVVATPGAEPVAEGGYAAVVLMDTWLLLGRVDLRAEEEAVRRWSNAIGLVRPGGRALVVGEPGHPAIQALVRWDQAGFAEREALARREAHLPPSSRLATITGSPGAVDDAVTLLAAPAGLEVLGPVPYDAPGHRGAQPGHAAPESRVVVRVPRAAGSSLSAALAELQRVRSARKLDAVRIQVDPPGL